MLVLPMTVNFSAGENKSDQLETLLSNCYWLMCCELLSYYNKKSVLSKFFWCYFTEQFAHSGAISDLLEYYSNKFLGKSDCVNVIS